MLDKQTSILLFAIALLACVQAGTLKDLPLRKHKSSAQRIADYGYPAESHQVETSDGYILNLFRIPYSPKLQNQNEYRPAILLQHGLFSCSDCYILNGPDNALAYMLADAGYDVWLGNARGNIYSRENSKLALENPLFWRFSWHEIGMIDLPAMIDFILEQTGQSALHYVGHSQGTTVFFVLMSMKPEYNAKIKTSHLLAPVAFMGNQKDAMMTTAAPILGVPGKWATLFGDQEFLPNNPFMQSLLNTACGGNIKYPEYCKQLYFLYGGVDQPNMNVTLLPEVAETHPAGVSTNQVMHYMQEYIHKRFCLFDKGPKGNMKSYGQVEPPNYPVENIIAPVSLYVGDADDSANPKDVSRIAALLPNLKLNYRVPNPTWAHLDFIFGKDVKAQINDLVIEACNEYENQVVYTLK